MAAYGRSFQDPTSYLDSTCRELRNTRKALREWKISRPVGFDDAPTDIHAAERQLELIVDHLQRVQNTPRGVVYDLETVELAKAVVDESCNGPADLSVHKLDFSATDSALEIGTNASTENVAQVSTKMQKAKKPGRKRKFDDPDEEKIIRTYQHVRKVKDTVAALKLQAMKGVSAERRVKRLQNREAQRRTRLNKLSDN